MVICPIHVAKSFKLLCATSFHAFTRPNNKPPTAAIGRKLTHSVQTMVDGGHSGLSGHQSACYTSLILHNHNIILLDCKLKIRIMGRPGNEVAVTRRYVTRRYVIPTVNHYLHMLLVVYVNQ